MEANERPERVRRRIPVLDLIRCSSCETCLDLCPEVFRRNPETGRIEVEDLSEYPQEAVQQAMSCCPKDCIDWEDAEEESNRRAQAQAARPGGPEVRG